MTTHEPVAAGPADSQPTAGPPSASPATDHQPTAVEPAGRPVGSPPTGSRRTNSGAGRALIAVYGIFALAATARAGVQIATSFDEAPLAYLLSAFAGVVYIVATFTLGRGTKASQRVALVAITVELVGVLTVGTASLLDPAAFPRATVWSVYGIGYGFVPVVLPVLGLLWVYRTGRRARETSPTPAG